MTVKITVMMMMMMMMMMREVSRRCTKGVFTPFLSPEGPLRDMFCSKLRFDI